ncbi:MAG: HD domain-containing protein [Candidatus Omnitrophota bacterium]
MGCFRFSLGNQAILRLVYSFARAKKIKLYLVGGILRDSLLNREKDNPDIDFCLKRGAINFGRDLSGEIKAGFVVLDKERGACRLVKKIKDKVCTLDFTDFREETLEDDLFHRDFTINSMALELESYLKCNDPDSLLVDPYKGRQDLKAKIIKVANKKAFTEDPLRILRIFSFACLLGFKIDKTTLKLAESEKKKLRDVSSERIRDELFKIFESPHAFDYLAMMDKLRILKIIFPETEKMRGVKQGRYHHLDVWRHSLEAVRQLEVLVKETKNNKEIQNYLNEYICGDRKRGALIKLALILHDIGKPDTLRRQNGRVRFHGHERVGLDISKNIVRRLKLSCDEIYSLHKMVLWHLRPGYMAGIEELSPRAVFRYFRDSGSEAVSTLLLSVADQRATKGPLTTEELRLHHEKISLGLIKEYFKRSKEKKLPRLINGDDLIKKLKLEPSPLIGRILSEIEELQAIGKIKNKAEALKAAAKIIK